MSPLEILQFALQNFQEDKVRAFLTILGIVVGVAAITALFSIGDSLNATVANQFASFGKDILFIEPDMTSGTSMMTTRVTDRDIDIAEMTRGVQTVIPFYESTATGKRGNTDASFFIMGIDPDKAEILFTTGYFELEEGRQLSSSDVYSFVTYSNSLDTSFDDEIGLRQTVEFNGKDFKLVGLMKENSFFNAMMGGASIALMNENTVKHFFGVDEATEAMVTVQPGYDPDDVATRLEAALEEEYGEKRFMVESSESLIEQMSMILFIIQTVLSFIALISLVVGTLGIINTMVMNVNERVREIGTMKAVGATNGTIQVIFMTEAFLLSVAGGIIGVTIGYLVTYIITVIVSASGFELSFVINPVLILSFICLTSIIGVVAGTIPAKIAAELEPTIALRYE